MLWWFNHCINHNQRLWCSRHIPCLLRSPTTSMRFIPRVQDTVPLTVTTIQDGTWLHVGWQWPPFATARVAALNPLDLLTWVHSCILACPGPTKFLFSLTHSIQSGYPILEVRPKLWNAKCSKQKSVVSIDLQSDWETKILIHSITLASRCDTLPCLSGASPFNLHSGFFIFSSPPPSHSMCTVKFLTAALSFFVLRRAALELDDFFSSSCTITSITTPVYHPSGYGGSGGHLIAISSPI